MKTPKDLLKHHVTGAVERGEKTAIEAVIKPTGVERTDVTVRPKFTPGPWIRLVHSTPTEYFIFKEHEETSSLPIAILPKAGGIANARLIAAAPEMFEALQMSLTCLKYFSIENYFAIQVIESVLRKATGGAE